MDTNNNQFNRNKYQNKNFQSNRFQQNRNQSNGQNFRNSNDFDNQIHNQYNQFRSDHKVKYNRTYQHNSHQHNSHQHNDYNFYDENESILSNSDKVKRDIIIGEELSYKYKNELLDFLYLSVDLYQLRYSILKTSEHAQQLKQQTYNVTPHFHGYNYFLILQFLP